jgi:hypothetical protein
MAVNSPPPQRNFINLPVLQKLTDAYKLWHNYLPHLPKLVKYSLAEKINILFTDVIELILTAGFTTKEYKPALIQKASIKLDTLKYFLQLAWELKALDNKQFAAISDSLVETGKMLGGWQRQVTKETPP